VTSDAARPRTVDSARRLCRNCEFRRERGRLRSTVDKTHHARGTPAPSLTETVGLLCTVVSPDFVMLWAQTAVRVLVLERRVRAVVEIVYRCRRRGDRGVEPAVAAGDAGGDVGSAAPDLLQHFSLAVGNVISSAVPGGTWMRSRTASTSRERGPRRYRSGLHPQHRLDQIGIGFDGRLGQKTTAIFYDNVLKSDVNTSCVRGHVEGPEWPGTVRWTLTLRD